MMSHLIQLTTVFLTLISLDSQLPPRRQGLVQLKDGSLSAQHILPKRTSGDIGAAFLHILHGQGALGLPVSGKLFREETKSTEVNCLNSPRNILTVGLRALNVLC